MDEERFLAFMKKKRKTQNTIETCVKNAREFENYILQRRKSLDETTAKDLESFVRECIEKKRVSKYMWSLSYFFVFLDNEPLLKTAGQLREKRIKVKRRTFKLKDFRGINPEHADALASIDVIDSAKMLEVGKTPKLRQELADKTNLNLEIIEEFVKLSDLARIQGFKAIRARLYYDAGFDKLEKLRKSTPEEVLRITREFVEKTGFDGIAPLPKEARGAITTAKKLLDIIEW